MKQAINTIFLGILLGLTAGGILVIHYSPKVQAQQPDLQYNIRKAAEPLVQALERSTAINKELVRSNNNLAHAIQDLNRAMRRH